MWKPAIALAKDPSLSAFRSDSLSLPETPRGAKSLVQAVAAQSVTRPNSHRRRSSQSPIQSELAVADPSSIEVPGQGPEQGPGKHNRGTIMPFINREFSGRLAAVCALGSALTLTSLATVPAFSAFQLFSAPAAWASTAPPKTPPNTTNGTHTTGLAGALAVTAPHASEPVGALAVARTNASELAHADAVARPNTDLNGSGSKVTFDPSKLTVPTLSGKTCTTSHYSFSIRNETKVKQQVKMNDKAFGKTIPPKYQLEVCAFKKGKGVFTLASSPAARLTVTVT
jgi:hypothetical protein